MALEWHGAASCGAREERVAMGAVDMHLLLLLLSCGTVSLPRATEARGNSWLVRARGGLELLERYNALTLLARFPSTRITLATVLFASSRLELSETFPSSSNHPCIAK